VNLLVRPAGLFSSELNTVRLTPLTQTDFGIEFEYNEHKAIITRF